MNEFEIQIMQIVHVSELEYVVTLDMDCCSFVCFQSIHLYVGYTYPVVEAKFIQV